MRRLLPLVLAVTVLAASAGCSSGDDAADLAPDGSRGTSGSGCDEPTFTSGAHTFESDGVEHRYLLEVPESVDGPMPLIVDLHGRSSFAEQQDAFSGMGRAGAARGFVVATPDSVRADRSWALPSVSADFSDASYVETLFDVVASGLCIDRTREYVVGLSNGAGLATALLCALGGQVAGIAPVAGVNLVRPCAEGAEPRTIVAFHGTADGVVPYAGGALFQGRPDLAERGGDALDAIDLVSVEDAIAGWAEMFHCGPVADERVADDVVHHTYAECDDGVTVQLYTVEAGGHTWPGGLPAAVLGRTTTSIDATQLILDAFSE